MRRRIRIVRRSLELLVGGIVAMLALCTPALASSPIEVLDQENIRLVKVDLQDSRVNVRVVLANNDTGGYQSLAGMGQRFNSGGYSDWVLINGDVFGSGCYGVNAGQGLTYIDGTRKDNCSSYGTTWQVRGNIGFNNSNYPKVSIGDAQTERNMVIGGGPWILRDGGTPECSYTESGGKVYFSTGEQFDGGAGSYCTDTRAITMIGYDRDHHTLFMAVSRGGRTVCQVAQWLKDRGAHEVLRFDSGGSSGMVHNGSVVAGSTSRAIANGIAVTVDSGSGIPSHVPNVRASDDEYPEKIRVTWDPVAGATHYDLYREPNSTGVHEGSWRANGLTGTSFDDTDADANTTYWYWVTACNSTGCSNDPADDYGTNDSGRRDSGSTPSGTWHVTFYNNTGLQFDPVVTEDIECDAIDHDYPHRSGLDDDNFSDRWERTINFPQSGKWRFHVYSDDGVRLFLDGNQIKEQWWEAHHEFNEDRDISAGNHTVKVEHYDKGSEARLRLSWSLLPDAPGTPSNVSATDGEHADKVRVSWNSVSGASRYEVHRANSATGTKTRVAEPSGTPWDDTDVAPGTTYHYWVKACNDGGCSDFSSSDSGYAQTDTPPTDTTPPTASWITPNDGATITTGSVTLAANASDSGDGVDYVRWSAKFGGSWHNLHYDYAAPYTFDWDLCADDVPDGDIELGLQAWDKAGNEFVYSERLPNYHITKQGGCQNDDPPTPLEPGDSHIASISSIGEEDWYTFTIDEANETQITVSTRNGSPAVALYDAGGMIASDDNPTAGKSATLYYTGSSVSSWLPPGTYTLRVAESGNDGTVSSYNVTLLTEGYYFALFEHPDWTGNAYVSGFSGSLEGHWLDNHASSLLLIERHAMWLYDRPDKIGPAQCICGLNGQDISSYFPGNTMNDGTTPLDDSISSFGFFYGEYHCPPILDPVSNVQASDGTLPVVEITCDINYDVVWPEAYSFWREPVSGGAKEQIAFLRDAYYDYRTYRIYTDTTAIAGVVYNYTVVPVGEYNVYGVESEPDTGYAASAADPYYDDFYAARPITVIPFSDSVDTSNATTQSGEPGHPTAARTVYASVWYKVEWDAIWNKIVRFSTAGSDYDTVLALYETDGPVPTGGDLPVMTLKVGNDDGEGTVTSYFEYYPWDIMGPPADRALWLQASSWSSSGGGQLELLVEQVFCEFPDCPNGHLECMGFPGAGCPGNCGYVCVPDDEPCTEDAYEPDDSMAQASAIASGETQTRSLCPRGDHDWISFWLGAESGVEINMSGWQDCSVAVEIVDEDGERVAFGNESQGPQIQRRCGADPLVPGQYAIHVWQPGGVYPVPDYSIAFDAYPCATNTPAPPDQGLYLPVIMND